MWDTKMDELMQGERPLVPFGSPGRGLQPHQDHQMGWEEPAIGTGKQKAFYPPFYPSSSSPLPDLRLQLLDVKNNPYLIKALYGLLMLLPQSSAFQLLSHRLQCVPNPELMQTA